MKLLVTFKGVLITDMLILWSTIIILMWILRYKPSRLQGPQGRRSSLVSRLLASPPSAGCESIVIRIIKKLKTFSTFDGYLSLCAALSPRKVVHRARARIDFCQHQALNVCRKNGSLTSQRKKTESSTQLSTDFCLHRSHIDS